MIELPVIDRADQNGGDSTERHWRSFAQLAEPGAFGQAHAEELMPGASHAPESASRRQFLQIMGASMAHAGLSACRRPEETILPYTRRPEVVIPGIPLFYATALPFRGDYRGVLVESHEGRPTKVEGNPEHPGSLGATSPFEQAAVLNLYDPDRSKRIIRDGAEATWSQFVRYAEEVGAQDGLRMAVLAEPDSSPTLRRLRTQLEARFPGLMWIEYAASGDDPGVQGLGGSVRPVYDFSIPDVIVSLDADFLSPTDRNSISNTRTFAAARRLSSPDDAMSRLYAIESSFSLTGGMADNRLRVRSSDVPAFAAALATALGVGASDNASARYSDHPFLRAIVEDVGRSGSRSVFVAGETQPPQVHALAAALNSALGSGAVRYIATGEAPSVSQSDALVRLAGLVRNGALDALMFLGTNPVYSAPTEFGMDQLVDQIGITIHHGLHFDETAQRCTWHIPATHPLEAWGDGRSYAGVSSIVQPLIAPLYEAAHSAIEVVNLFATGSSVSGYDLVRESWQELGEDGWRQALHDGVIPDTEYPAADPGTGDLAAVQLPPDPEALELVFRLDSSVLDGSYANNAWLQELPDPTTKIVWDNVATVSRATADRLGLEVEYDAGKFYADVIEIRAGSSNVEIPVWVVPGHADNSIGLSLGYGRSIVSGRSPRDHAFFNKDARTDIYGDGPLANGVGTNVAGLRSVQFAAIRIDDVEVAKTGRKMMVATTQEHGSMEGRPLARMATLEDFRRQPHFAEEAVPVVGGDGRWEEYPALWQENHPADSPAHKDTPYYAHQWGMVIDLNTCTGCSACIVACDSENNVQMVGKDQVARGREMHWLRVDRYYVSEPVGTEVAAGGYEEGGVDYDDVRMVMQPLPCQHCENAPCESVCPVAATMHSSDGTNQMIYNRCIGTRYCSNNCPYKVRRFNFYNWSKTIPTQVQMAQNPNVTVRFRGVMEKCSFCIQRIREANRRTIVEGKPIEDGDVKTACQQVCPADAIVFGDIADPDSQVSLLRLNPRRYEMLAELNTKPRTSYLARVRNPNPLLSGRA